MIKDSDRETITANQPITADEAKASSDKEGTH
jgi:hypothetical protein